MNQVCLIAKNRLPKLFDWSGLQLAREFKGADRKELESTKATTPGDN